MVGLHVDCRRRNFAGGGVEDALHLCWIERLYYMMVEAGLAGAQFIGVLPPVGDCHQEDAGVAGLGAQAVREFVTADAGQANVEKRQRRLIFIGGAQAREAVMFHSHLVTHAAEYGGEAGGEVVIVVDNQGAVVHMSNWVGGGSRRRQRARSAGQRQRDGETTTQTQTSTHGVDG